MSSTAFCLGSLTTHQNFCRKTSSALHVAPRSLSPRQEEQGLLSGVVFSPPATIYIRFSQARVDLSWPVPRPFVVAFVVSTEHEQR